MLYCGIDLSKKSSNYCIVDDDGRVVAEGKVDNDRADFRKALADYSQLKVLIEASNNAFWVADAVEELGHDVAVCDPKSVLSIGRDHTKTDKRDARNLAKCCRVRAYVSVYRPTADERAGRMPIVAREQLIRARTKLINLVRSTLASEGILVAKCQGKTFSEKVENARDKGRISDAMWVALGPVMNSILQLTLDELGLMKMFEEEAETNETTKLLTTVPGVGPVVATAFRRMVLTPKRFESGRQVGAYMGLTPTTYQSGKTHRRGQISRQGSRRLRWLLTMAASALLKSTKESALRQWGMRKWKQFNSRKKAVVAVARKLAVLMWAMWRDGERFDAKLVEQQKVTPATR